MKRKLIVGERIMYANGEQPVNCVFSVTLNGTIQQADLESAFLRLQARHPLLRAAIREEEKYRPYFDIGENVVTAGVEVLTRNTDEDWLKIAEAEWHRPFDYHRPPLMRVILLDGGNTSDLLIVLPHCICDGATIVNLMRELLAYTGNPLQEALPYTSFTVPADLVAPADMPGKATLVKARLLSYVARGVLSLMTRNKQEATGRAHYMIRWSVDKELSQALVAAGKAADTTIHTALSTAFLMAFGKVRGKDARNKVICPVDIRKSVQGIGEDIMFAFAPVVELGGAGQDRKEFWNYARRIKLDLQQKRSRLKPNHMLVLTEYFHPAADKMLKHLRTTRGSHDVTLSNMGKINIPVQYDGFSVSRVYAPSTALPWKNPTTLVATSFDDQLDFSLLSEEAFLPQETALAIKEEAMSILKEVVHSAV